MSEGLIEIKDLKKYFTLDHDLLGRPTSVLKAVDGVSFHIDKGETFGLVGESGCGKTTIGKILVNLYTATKGHVLFEGVDLTSLSEAKRRIYSKDIQLIFQDPYSSLNPRMTIGDTIAEPIRINHLLPKDQIEKRVTTLLNFVGLANHQRNRYPHEFSGGQRQRVGIARALAVQPKLIVCDEPVSALDVSIQAQVLNLLDELKNEFGLTYLFIAHGLNVVKHISNRVGVMYLGKLVETAPKKELSSNPLHPYTQALLSAIPSVDPTKKRKRIILTGDVPSPINLPGGCRFCTRCPKKMEGCDLEEPVMKEVSPGHFVSCFLYR